MKRTYALKNFRLLDEKSAVSGGLCSGYERPSSAGFSENTFMLFASK
ncbi:MAG TPA: hypothetical protein VGT04_10785 [Acidobacteriaceae bacterium]|nr:hypothetical protein [Acidobacteriaceae bacterium]